MSEIKGICDQIQDKTLRAQLKLAVNKFNLYFEFLEDIKNQNIDRIKELDKRELE